MSFWLQNSSNVAVMLFFYYFYVTNFHFYSFLVSHLCSFHSIDYLITEIILGGLLFFVILFSGKLRGKLSVFNLWRLKYPTRIGFCGFSFLSVFLICFAFINFTANIYLFVREKKKTILDLFIQ